MGNNCTACESCNGENKMEFKDIDPTSKNYVQDSSFKTQSNTKYVYL